MTGTKRIVGSRTAVQMASASFVGFRGCTAATVLLTIGLAPLHERLDAGGRDQPHLMVGLRQFPRSVVSSGAGFEADPALPPLNH